MTVASESPWAERFVALVDKDEIRRKITVLPRPFTDYQKLPPAQASLEFKARLDEMYFPGAQCVEIIAEWVGLALEHCQRHYREPQSFLAAVYGEEVPLRAFSFPMCLTGLAGTGKSKLLTAFERLMPPDATFVTNDKTTFRMESHRVLTVQARASATDILIALTGQNGNARMLTGVARKRAYRDGWAFLGVDEFQFLTQSDKANTRLVQLLMLVSYVGIPVVFVSNFSMLHKLLRRNQEDRQRLLGNVRALFPEPPSSDDWANMLEWHKRIAPDVFEFDAKADAGAIHQLTAGINRAENKLLELAFRYAMESGRAVGLRELEIAYRSRDYAVYRTDIEILSRLPFNAALKKAHPDLWCPFDITPSPVSAEIFSAKREEKVGAAAVEASLNAAEREAFKAIVPISPPKRSRLGKAAKLIAISKTQSLAEQLREDSAWFDENS